MFLQTEHSCLDRRDKTLTWLMDMVFCWRLYVYSTKPQASTREESTESTWHWPKNEAKWVCLKIVYPIFPMVLLIIIPTKWLFHWGFGPHFQTYPWHGDSAHSQVLMSSVGSLLPNCDPPNSGSGSVAFARNLWRPFGGQSSFVGYTFSTEKK